MRKGTPLERLNPLPVDEGWRYKLLHKPQKGRIEIQAIYRGKRKYIICVDPRFFDDEWKQKGEQQ